MIPVGLEESYSGERELVEFWNHWFPRVKQLTDWQANYILHCLQVEVNTDMIPVGLEESYSRERAGRTLESLVPMGKTLDQFADNLGVKFKSVSVVYFHQRKEYPLS